MAEVIVLVEGYAREENGVEYASPSSVLIKDNKLNIIVDPGMNRELLLKALNKQSLSTKDINYVIITHFHPDHALLAGIFENAKVIDDDSINSWDSKIEPHNGKVPGTNIKLILTPGHEYFHCSVLVETDKGKIVISGDVFWWGDDEEQQTDKQSLINHKDPYVKDEKALAESREKLLQIADYIIPGHGKMFKVEK